MPNGLVPGALSWNDAGPAHREADRARPRSQRRRRQTGHPRPARERPCGVRANASRRCRSCAPAAKPPRTHVSGRRALSRPSRSRRLSSIVPPAPSRRRALREGSIYASHRTTGDPGPYIPTATAVSKRSFLWMQLPKSGLKVRKRSFGLRMRIRASVCIGPSVRRPPGTATDSPAPDTKSARLPGSLCKPSAAIGRPGLRQRLERPR